METTWSERGSLDSYQTSREMLLDVVHDYEHQVLPGTVQVFDTEVVRDTKEVAIRLGWASAFTVPLMLAVGGLALGGMLTAFQAEESDAGGEASTVRGATQESAQPGPAPAGLVVNAKNIKFNVSVIEATAGELFTVTFKER